MAAAPGTPGAPHRIPLTTLAVAFGLSGLAETWSAAAEVLALPRWLPQAVWALTAAAWVWLVAAHLVRGARSPERLRDQLRHRAQGPIAALAPVTAMLLGAQLATVAPTAGRVVVVVAIVAAALFAGWLLGTWLDGSLPLEAIHGGYLLPTVAAGLVAADAAGVVGLPLLGWLAFGVGAFFAVVVTTMIVLRLALRPPLPDPLVPSMAVLMAPPAVAGIAWFRLAGDEMGPVPAALAGLAVVMVLVQLALVPRYVRTPFSLGYWSFTFPAGAVCAFAVEWLAASGTAATAPVTVVLVAALTVALAALSVRSLALVGRRRPGPAAPAPTTGLRPADVPQAG